MTTNEHGANAGDSTSAAARLLEIATRNADELLGEARAEAASVTDAAHADAKRVHAELERTGIEQSDELDRHRATVFAELAERQAGFEAEVARLGAARRRYPCSDSQLPDRAARADRFDSRA